MVKGNKPLVKNFNLLMYKICTVSFVYLLHHKINTKIQYN